MPSQNTPSVTPVLPLPALLWDLFCRVVDNWGDIGACWRLACNLTAHGQRVRLWIDDTSAMVWMAPGALEGTYDGIEVLAWNICQSSEKLRHIPRADVWVETFGCEIAAEFIAHGVNSPPHNLGHTRRPVWINLEHLSAQSFVERNHQLPSPVMHGPAVGWTKYFFYPGFTYKTGGLMREANLHNRQREFNKPQWLAHHGVPWRGERLVSLFCYEPKALPELVQQLLSGTCPTRLLVTAGKATQAVQSIEKTLFTTSSRHEYGALSIVYLPGLTQLEYDELLWSCDFNCVRGEDSIVRALWANKPFVWQVYPQDDAEHYSKLDAFLEFIHADSSWRDFHRAWNAGPGMTSHPLPTLDLAAWQALVNTAHMQLLKQQDLCTQLLQFVAEKR